MGTYDIITYSCVQFFILFFRVHTHTHNNNNNNILYYADDPTTTTTTTTTIWSKMISKNLRFYIPRVLPAVPTPVMIIIIIIVICAQLIIGVPDNLYGAFPPSQTFYLFFSQINFVQIENALKFARRYPTRYLTIVLLYIYTLGVQYAGSPVYSSCVYIYIYIQVRLVYLDVYKI